MKVKEAALALGVGGPLLQANPVQPKKTNPNLNEVKAPYAIGNARQTVVRRKMENNSTNKSFSRERVAGELCIEKTRTPKEKIFVHNELQSKSVNNLPAKEKNLENLGQKGIKIVPDAVILTPAALLKSQTRQAVMGTSKQIIAVKKEPGMLGDKSTLGKRTKAIPGINRSVIFAKSRARRIGSHSKSGKLPLGKLAVKQERPEILGQALKNSRIRVLNAKKHQNPGNLKQPKHGQKAKTSPKLVAKMSKNAVKANSGTKPAVKVENSLDERPDDEEEVAIEYEEREESACPYCMKQFNCWEKVTAHMAKIHANQC